jgi:hypothetical protein
MMQKKRNMSLRGFVHKATSAKGAVGFLAAHADFIRQHAILAPFLDSYEKGKELASPTLIMIRDLAFAQMVDDEIDSARNRAVNVREKKVKTYTVTIICQDGPGKSEGFAMMQEAEGWADRRMFEDASSLYANVVSTHIGKSGTPICWRVERNDSIARTLKHKTGAVMKVASKTTDKLGFGVKVHNDRCSFSRG